MCGSLPRGLHYGQRKHSPWAAQVLACLRSVVWNAQTRSEEALGGGGGSLCAWARLAGRRLSVSSSRGQSSCGYSLTAQTEAPGDPLVFSLFPCPHLLLS